MARLMASLLAAGALALAPTGPLRAEVAAAEATATSPREVVETLNRALLDTLRHARELGFEGRYRKLAPVIDAAYDLPAIARVAIGSEWDKLSPAQRNGYLERFRKDTIATYAQRFDGYGGQRFEIVGEREVAAGRHEVNTVIVGGDTEPTPINYTLAQSDGRWRIINVVARGVSELALKRSQYLAVLRSEGPEALLRRLDELLQKYPPLPDA